MKQVKFLKAHLDNKVGDVAKFEDGIADYLVRVGVAKSHQPPLPAEDKRLIEKKKESKTVKRNPKKKSD